MQFSCTAGHQRQDRVQHVQDSEFNFQYTHTHILTERHAQAHTHICAHRHMKHVCMHTRPHPYTSLQTQVQYPRDLITYKQQFRNLKCLLIETLRLRDTQPYCCGNEPPPPETLNKRVLWSISFKNVTRENSQQSHHWGCSSNPGTKSRTARTCRSHLGRLAVW